MNGQDKREWMAGDVVRLVGDRFPQFTGRRCLVLKARIDSKELVCAVAGFHGTWSFSPEEVRLEFRSTDKPA